MNRRRLLRTLAAGSTIAGVDLLRPAYPRATPAEAEAARVRGGEPGAVLLISPFGAAPSTSAGGGE